MSSLPSCCAFFLILITTDHAPCCENRPRSRLTIVCASKGSRVQYLPEDTADPGALPLLLFVHEGWRLLRWPARIVGEFVDSSRGLGYLMIQCRDSF